MFVMRSLAFSGERLAPLQPQMGWGTPFQPILAHRVSLNQALNPFDTEHIGHRTLRPHALGSERDDKDH
jgi:hypothetical protein